MTKCIEADCKNEVDKKINPLWCPDCNKKRVEMVDKQMKGLMAAFK